MQKKSVQPIFIISLSYILYVFKRKKVLSIIKTVTKRTNFTQIVMSTSFSLDRFKSNKAAIKSSVSNQVITGFFR